MTTSEAQAVLKAWAWCEAGTELPYPLIEGATLRVALAGAADEPIIWLTLFLPESVVGRDGDPIYIADVSPCSAVGEATERLDALVASEGHPGNMPTSLARDITAAFSDLKSRWPLASTLRRAFAAVEATPHYGSLAHH